MFSSLCVCTVAEELVQVQLNSLFADNKEELILLSPAAVWHTVPVSLCNNRMCKHGRT